MDTTYVSILSHGISFLLQRFVFLAKFGIISRNQREGTLFRASRIQNRVGFGSWHGLRNPGNREIWKHFSKAVRYWNSGAGIEFLFRGNWATILLAFFLVINTRAKIATFFGWNGQFSSTSSPNHPRGIRINIGKIVELSMDLQFLSPAIPLSL